MMKILLYISYILYYLIHSGMTMYDNVHMCLCVCVLYRMYDMFYDITLTDMYVYYIYMYIITWYEYDIIETKYTIRY